MRGRLSPEQFLEYVDAKARRSYRSGRRGLSMGHRRKRRNQPMTTVRRQQIVRKWSVAMDERAEVYWFVEELRAKKA